MLSFWGSDILIESNEASALKMCGCFDYDWEVACERDFDCVVVVVSSIEAISLR
jgi:hypothetical protein